MTVQDGKFEKPQLKKTAKKTSDTVTKAEIKTKEIKDGVITIIFEINVVLSFCTVHFNVAHIYGSLN